MTKELSNRIKELRKARGLSQKGLASMLGLGQTTIANYEQGTRLPDTEKLRKMADIFEVTLDYLVGREDNKELLKFKCDIGEAYKSYIEYLINGRREEARKLVVSLYEQGTGIEDIYFSIFEKALRQVGTLWETGIIDVWKEHFISETTIDLMREIKSKEKKRNNEIRSIMALTSGPEMHNIGLRIIIDMLELEGWNTIYLGTNVPVQSVIRAIEDEKPDILAVSVTMRYHIEAAKNMIAAIKNHFGKKAPKIIVGGSAFEWCENACEETGADYYGIKIEDIKNIYKK